MPRSRKFLIIIIAFLLIKCSPGIEPVAYEGLDESIIHPGKDSVVNDTIVYHPVHVNQDGNILPWYSADPAIAYNDVLKRVWQFWKNMETDTNGEKYYMNHQVWRPGHDKRGLGGDQLMMAMSSWNLYYDYTGDAGLIQNMKYMADYYLEHSLSAPGCAWPYLPYPYNTNVESGIYDGDMILGKDFLQPDKGGSFGFELVKLFKKTGDEKYLDAAVNIANTLAQKVQPGDSSHSPWPFKVNAKTGGAGLIVLDQVVWYEGLDKDIRRQNRKTMQSAYTSNWTGTLELFDQLISLHKGDTAAYKRAFDMALGWMKNFPAKTNRWGPFFEDVPRWSDTQINAITYAMYLLEHPELDPAWKQAVKNTFTWVHKELGDKEFMKYGVETTDEQTAYRVPGNSHSSREASVELMYWEKTGDTSYVRNAVRQLNWATYMVDDDGKNYYPTNDIWMTDGYGDYVRHYLRAMAAAPQLAPGNEDHLLRSSSIVKEIRYAPQQISYITFDEPSLEKFRLASKPKEVNVNGKELEQTADKNGEGWYWQPLPEGGVLVIHKAHGTTVQVSR
ncbi:MAG TPA: hypothetical protein VFW07_00920 [Parafilimonas sp.]|nr:hypothetical protein [Parafilimonas sp.]